MTSLRCITWDTFAAGVHCVLLMFNLLISFMITSLDKNGLTPEMQPPIILLERHYNNVIMSMIASQITSLTIVYSTVSSDADERKHQSSASLAFVQGIHRRPVNSPRKWPVTRNVFPFDDVIMEHANPPITHWISFRNWCSNHSDTQLKTVSIYEDVIKGNIFRVTGLLCGEFTGDRGIPLTKASDAELWCFRWSAPE